MGFLSEYYLWFIIGGIILVMAIIGYIADKTDFGRKAKINNENNKLKEEKVNDTSVTEAPVTEVQEVISETPIVSDIEETSKSINELEVPEMQEPSNIVIDDPINEDIKDIQIEENNIEQPVIDDITDISEPLEIEKEGVEIKEIIDDSAYVLNNDLSSFAAGANNEVVDAVVEPVSNTIEEVINEQETDDDIWKF